MSSAADSDIPGSSENNSEDNAADNCISNGGGMHVVTANAIEYEKQITADTRNAIISDGNVLKDADEEDDEEEEDEPLTNGIHNYNKSSSRDSSANQSPCSTTELNEKPSLPMVASNNASIVDETDDVIKHEQKVKEDDIVVNTSDSTSDFQKISSCDDQKNAECVTTTSGSVVVLTNGETFVNGDTDKIVDDDDDKTTDTVKEGDLSPKKEVPVENGVGGSPPHYKSADEARPEDTEQQQDKSNEELTKKTSDDSSSSNYKNGGNHGDDDVDDDNNSDTSSKMEIDESEQPNCSSDLNKSLVVVISGLSKANAPVSVVGNNSQEKTLITVKKEVIENNNINRLFKETPKVEDRKSVVISSEKVIKVLQTTIKQEQSSSEENNINKVKSIAVKKAAQLTESHPTLKVNGNVTATKRRLEELEAEQEGGMSSGSEGDSNAQDCKRIRFDESIFEEDERERLIREFVDRSADTLEGINKNCEKLQQEIGSLLEIARAKELEWNSIMRLLKLKEEMLERVLFKKRQAEFNGGKPVDLETNIHKMHKNNYIVTAEQNNKGARSETNTPNSLGSVGSSFVSGGGGRNTPSSGGPSSTLSPASTPLLSGGTASMTTNQNHNNSSNVVNTNSLQDYYKYPNSGNALANAAMLSADAYAKLRSNRPILPKPPSSSSISAIASILEQPVIGEGRQGAILDVKSIIADFRSKNPPEPQTRRGRRVVQPSQSTLSVAAVAAAVSNARLENNAAAAAIAASSPAIGTTQHGPTRFLGNTSLLSMANLALGSGSHVRTSVSSTSHPDHHPTSSSFLLAPDVMPPSLKQDVQLRGVSGGVVSSNMDSVIMTSSGPIAAAAASSQHSFQEALVKFARMNEGKNASPSSSTSSVGGGGGTSANTNSSATAAAIMHQQQQQQQHHHHHQQQQQQMLCQSNSIGKSSQHLPPPPPYPEVTLHPVIVPHTTASPTVQNSLLHGILTKSNNQQQQQQQQSSQHGGISNSSQAVITGGVGSAIQHRPTTFSPTLARLLTAPERNSRVNRNANAVAANSVAGGNTSLSRVQAKSSTLNEILNSKRTKSEVTITPVSSSSSCNNNKINSDVIQLDEDEEPDDRLVIDESRDSNVIDTSPNVIPADQVPECQGCHKKAAQFVCAGCGNQWYCSRECQVQAWEDHSEMCSG